MERAVGNPENQILLTGAQVKQLNDFMGGDYEMDVTLMMHEGDLVVWATDCPEEGWTVLDGDSEEIPAGIAGFWSLTA